MSVQNRISVTLSPRTKKALELAAGLDGSTTATYATQLLSSAIKSDIKEDPILLEKWIEVEKEAIKNESWDNIALPLTVSPEELRSTRPVQKGWFISGDNPDCYEVGTDKAVVYSKAPSGFIKSKRKNFKGFGTLMQQTNIEDYIGKKLELTAVIKTGDVKQWAGLWARLDDDNMKCLWFDNMQDRPLKGATNWKQVHITMDVPIESSVLNFGVLLVGPGNVWMNDFNLYELSGNKKISVTDLDIDLSF
ncbi:MAG TPA: hypothetical protein VK712_00105 [Verrucomicrobiae bacterium]|nr:hypothetical protein [Verrucomicrobiae bacterium]